VATPSFSNARSTESLTGWLHHRVMCNDENKCLLSLFVFLLQCYTSIHHLTML
jgi:hypothetical protein